MKLPRRPALASGTISRLLDYDWPGNVRALENVVERALIMNRGEPLVFTDALIPKKADPTAPRSCWGLIPARFVSVCPNSESVTEEDLR